MMNVTQSHSLFGRSITTLRPAALAAAILLVTLLGLARPARAVHEEWNRRWSDPTHFYDTGIKVAVDRSGDIYVGAVNTGAGQYDYRIIKYRPDGSEVWTRSYDGPAHGQDVLVDLGLDADGNVYVTGYSLTLDAGGLGHYGYATLKYSPAGARLWVQRYDNLATNGDYASALAVDAAGNVYVTGTTNTSVPAPAYSRMDAVTVKYSPSGQPLWVRTYAPGYAIGEKVALDADDNILLAVKSDLAGSCATLKYSANGDVIWTAALTGTLALGQVALAVDEAGSVYLSGGDTDYSTAKYDSDGHLLWKRSYLPRGSGQSYATCLALDPSGAVLVGGSNGTVKYRADGKLLWTETDRANALAVDTAGCVYAAGYTTGRSPDYLLVKYGADGRVHWSRKYSGPAHGTDQANALALDSVGNIYITGVSQDLFPGSAKRVYDARTLRYSQPILASPYQPIPGLP